MAQEQPIKYGDIFSVADQDVAEETIGPKDAAAMQAAENQVLGETRRGGPASVMQSAATKNVRAGVVPPGGSTHVGPRDGMSVTQSIVNGRRYITESVGDQDAKRKLGDDKPANVEDAERVIAAELRNNPEMGTNLGGVAQSLSSAAKLNQQKFKG